MRTKKSAYYFLVLVAGILILLNILSSSYFFRLDFTADKRYTLSNPTKTMLKELTEPVTVKAYFTEGLPPNIEIVRTEFRELLIEYKTASKGMLGFVFSNPNEKPEMEQEAMQAGIQPLIIGSNEKDQSVQKKAYLGAVVKCGDKTEIIPLVQPGTAMEYELTTAIKKMITKAKKSIAILQGQGEPSMAAIPQVIQSLSVMYTTEPLYLSDTAKIPERFKTMVIIAPKDSFPPSYLKQLNEFQSQGGNLVIAMERVDGNLNTQSPMGKAVSTGLENWLQAEGIIVEPNLVIDSRCNQIRMQQQVGGFTMVTPVAFPYFPDISNFAKTPATQGLESVFMPFASEVRFSGDSSLQFTVLARTSEKSGKQDAPVYFDFNYQWQESDFHDKGLPVAAMVSGKLSGNNPSKMIVFGCGKFAINGEGEQAMQLPPDNVNLLVNSIDYLSDDSGLMELRTKGISSRPLKEINDTGRLGWKLFNVLFPVILIIGYGIFRIQKNRIIRTKRMWEDYV
jgi:gliding-associated putative ABC transporter substrate-binding component GldG